MGRAVLLLLLASTASWAGGLPEFSLADPTGKSWSSTTWVDGNLVLIVTAPTLVNEDDQRGWHKHLEATRPASAPRLVFIEDLSVSWFADVAVAMMREAFDPETGPLLLLDRDGAVRRSLTVAENSTEVLVYRGGKQVLVEKREPSAEGAARIWAALTSEPESAP